MQNPTAYRNVDRIIDGTPASDGRGVKLYRVLGQPSLMELDPFLLLDEFRSDKASDYIGGFPDHPHRGFQTVTYMLAGRMRHKDNQGHEGVLEPGGIQWMNAGRGIVHSEMPEQEAGLLHGFQLWVNLPAAEKMSQPFYSEFGRDEIPVEEKNGSEIRVIAGAVENGVAGPVTGIAGNPLYLDVHLPAEAAFEQDITSGHNAMLYLYEGSADLESSPETLQIAKGQLATFHREGDAVRLTAGNSGCRFLLLACAVLEEPVARYGPFVMNTESEIRQAIRDYSSGKF